MLLAIDVRNTHTVVGLVSGSGDHAKVVQHWRIRTESEVTADELALTIDGLIGDDSERLTGAAGLSTVPSVLHEVRVMLEQYWPSVPHVLIEPGVRTGIPLLVDNPKEVGADRIVNCLAAYHKYGTAAIVVDFGSSICVDVVSAKGEFLGGAIAPGVQVSSDAAAARSAALRRVELTRPRSVVGKNTVECMQAGAVFGFAGLVDGLVSRIREDVDGFGGDDVAVVATGHTAPLVLPDLHTVEHYDQHLTLDGLRLVFERNRDSQRGASCKQARSLQRQKNVRIRSTTRSSSSSTGISCHLSKTVQGWRDPELAASRRPRTCGRSAPSRQERVLVVELDDLRCRAGRAAPAGPGRTTRRGGPSSAAPDPARAATPPAPTLAARDAGRRARRGSAVTSAYSPSSWVR